MNSLSWILLVAFVFSYLGSIPPGSINISVMQLALNGKKAAALRFALAAALVEYPYAYLAVGFSDLFNVQDLINEFELLAALVMIALGIISWWQHRNPVRRSSRFHDSGFRKGLVISILNPLAIPFWIAVSVYLEHMGWVQMESELQYHSFVIGVSLGTFTLLATVVLLAKKLGERFAESQIVRFLPAIAFLVLGLYSLLNQFLG